MTSRWAGQSWVWFWLGARDFSLPQTSRLSLGSTLPPTQLVPGSFSPGVKWLGHENHSLPALPASAKVKKEWRNTSHPAICLHGIDRDIIFLPYKKCFKAIYFCLYFQYAQHWHFSLSFSPVTQHICHAFIWKFYWTQRIYHIFSNLIRTRI